MYLTKQEIRTKKSAVLLVYSRSEVFGVTRQNKYNQKPAPKSASISTIIPFCLLVAKLSEQMNNAKTLSQYV